MTSQAAGFVQLPLYQASFDVSERGRRVQFDPVAAPRLDGGQVALAAAGVVA